MTDEELGLDLLQAIAAAPVIAWQTTYLCRSDRLADALAIIEDEPGHFSASVTPEGSGRVSIRQITHGAKPRIVARRWIAIVSAVPLYAPNLTEQIGAHARRMVVSGSDTVDILESTPRARYKWYAVFADLAKSAALAFGLLGALWAVYELFLWRPGAP